jgi:hypothetical protein
MTITERIAEVEAEFNRATTEMNGWNARRLRAEGALFVLRQLAAEEGQTEEVAPAQPIEQEQSPKPKEQPIEKESLM